MNIKKKHLKGENMAKYVRIYFKSVHTIQYNTIFSNTHIRIRAEVRAYRVLLFNNILTKCKRQ